MAMRLVMAALGLDLLLHGAGLACFGLVAHPRLPGGSSEISISAPCSIG